MFNIKKKIRLLLKKNQEINPIRAYDLWASTYDNQPGNLLIYLDEQVFTTMTTTLALEHKVIVDIGCGTGRHWPALLSRQPAKLIGYDVSKEMLNVLRQKFPEAHAHVLQDDLLADLDDNSCDVIICNLVIGYIKDLKAAFTEWSRVLKSGGYATFIPMPCNRVRSGLLPTIRRKC